MNLRRLSFSLALSLTAVAGCDAPEPVPVPTCTDPALIAIVAPSGIISTDVNAAAAGVQTSVNVRTSFAAGVELTLAITPQGGSAALTTAVTDGSGNAAFAGVTVPSGRVELRVSGEDECGPVEDLREVMVVAGAGCEVRFAITPEANDFYAPVAVLDAETDADAAPGFQGEVIVTTMAGFDINVYRSGAGTLEALVGSGRAGAEGGMSLAISLPEGQSDVRAECVGPDGVGSRASLATSVFVDTVAPACSIASPVPGTSLTPALDGDQDRDNGLQVTLGGHVAGADVAGEPASFIITAPGGGTTTVTAGTVNGVGAASATATFDPPAPPSNYGVAFTARDHAGNGCTTDHSYRVVYDGCAISVVAPLTVTTQDADATAGNGAQVDVVLDVADECIGRTVTSDCGTNDVSGTIGAGGAVTLRADVCGAVPCEASELCTVRVVSADGIETTAGVALGFDNQAPNVSVQVAAPSGITCGGVVVPEQDLDPGVPGIQIAIRVVSPAAADKQLRMINASGTAFFDADTSGSEVRVTIDAAANDFAGVVTDAVGNSATSSTCRVTLADVAVGFTGSPADGLVGPPDGTGADAGSLSFVLSGTTSASGASVAVSVDGGAATAATVIGTSWTLPMTLAGRTAPYTITAVATSGPRIGSGTLALVVDLTPPPPVGAPSGTADTRQSVRVDFTAPGDGGQAVAAYQVRYATAPFTDAGFDTAGTLAVAPTPATPGAAQSVRITAARTGQAFWIGVATVDAAGNRSPAAIVGPLTPAFDATAPEVGPSGSGLGHAMVRGRFDADGFDDVAVAAPFATSTGGAGAGEVRVYFGSASGLSPTPGLIIRGTSAGGSLGSSLARVRWRDATHDDLAIGEPFADGGSGRIMIFHGGAAFPSGLVDATAAPTRISVNPISNWFSGSALGWQLATADHDGDGVDDLVATAVFGAAGNAGAALVFYGGTVPTGPVLISDATAAGSGTAVIRMYEQVGFTLFGYYARSLGPTQGPADAADDIGVAFVEDGVPGGDIVVLRATSGRPPAPGVTQEPFTVGRDVRIRYATSDDTLEWGSDMTSIADQNGDGARDLVFADHRAGNDVGVVFVVDGDTTGTAGVASLADAGVVISTFTGDAAGAQFGMAVLDDAGATAPDVDGDGREDLVIAGRVSGQTQAALLVWFGPIPHGSVSAVGADHAIVGPASFQGAAPSNGGTAMAAIWAGDVNGDGLDDVCWADKTSASGAGSFQVLWDDGL